MRTTKAAVLTAPKAPVEVKEVPVGELASDEVLVKIEACGVCHSELMISKLESFPALPLVMGHEGVGRVEEVGAKVTNVRVGDRVGITYLAWTCGECDMCRSGRERFCAKQLQHGYSQPGALTQWARPKAQQLVKVPDALPAHTVAPLFCAGWTSYSAVKGAGLKDGQVLGIFGFGGLGHLALQYAKHFGLRVAVADVSEEKLAQARELGAELAVPAADAGRAILKGIGGADAAIAFTPANEAIGQAFRALKRGGNLQLVGMAANARYDLPLNDTVLKGVSVRGSYLGTRAELDEILQLALKGVGVPHVETHRLEEAPEVLAKLAAGKILGRAVITF